MIIDAHTHIGTYDEAPLNESAEKNKELLLAEMDAAGVDLALVLAGYSETRDNDPVTEKAIEILKSEPRLRCVGSIDLEKYDKIYLDRLDAWLEDGSLSGVKFYLGYQHVYPYEERCRPIYELCVKHNAPVIFHSGDTLTTKYSNAKVRYAHPLPIDDVAVEFPNLKIVIAHLGNPWIIDCAQVLYKNKNVHADLSGLAVGDIDSSYGEWLTNQIKNFVAWSGASDKLLYGSDWPLVRLNEYIAFVERLGFSDNEREKIFSKNAIELFGL